MAKFRRGAEALVASAEASANRGGGRSDFTRFLSWGTDDKTKSKFIQFITPLDEVPTVLMHQFIITGQTKKGKDIYDNFISRRDEQLDGMDGFDLLQDRWEMQPRDRGVALAVELSPKYEMVKGKRRIAGVEPLMIEWTDKEDNKHEDPAVGFIVQAPSNFFGYLTTWQETSGKEITDVVWAVTRSGKSTDTRYDFVVVDAAGVEPVDVESLGDLPELDTFLDELSSEERMRNKLVNKPAGFKVSRYSTVDNGPTGDAGSGDTQVEQEEGAPWEEQTADPAQKERRVSKFDRLRDKVE